MTPHPLTQVSIRLQRTETIAEFVTIYDCGCEEWRGKPWRLCTYHDGYNDATTALADRIEEMVRVSELVMNDGFDESKSPLPPMIGDHGFRRHACGCDWGSGTYNLPCGDHDPRVGLRAAIDAWRAV